MESNFLFLNNLLILMCSHTLVGEIQAGTWWHKNVGVGELLLQSLFTSQPGQGFVYYEDAGSCYCKRQIKQVIKF